MIENKEKLHADWVLLICLFIFLFLVGSETFLISPIIPTIATSLNVSVVEVANIVLVYVLVYAILGPIIGVISDFKGRARLIISGFVLFFIGNLSAGLSNSLTSLMISRGLMGVGAACAGPSVWAFIAETTHSSKKGRFIGFGMGAFSLGQILGVPAGSILTAKFSWHVPFFSMSGITLIILPIVYFLVKNYPFTPKKCNFTTLFFSFSKIFQNLKSILPLGVTFFWAAANLGSYTYLGVLLKDKFSWNTEQIGFVIIIVGIGSLIGSLFSGKLFDYWILKKRNVEILVGCWVIMLGISISGLVFLNNFILNMVFLFIWFITSGSFVTSQQTYLALSVPEAKGVMLSINNSIMYAGTATGVFLIGALPGKLWNNIGLITIICCIFSFVFSFLIFLNKKRFINFQENGNVARS